MYFILDVGSLNLIGAWNVVNEFFHLVMCNSLVCVDV